MKKFILKQWYPSLDNELKKGDVIEWDDNNNKYLIIKQIVKYIHIDKHEVENNPDFWELIEEEKPKPLFITDDGVELFDEEDKLFIVNKEFYKKESKISNLYDKANRKYFKYFFHESNADEYIWKNKRVFSYQDIIEHAYNSPKYRSFIEKLAMERANQ